MVNKLTQSERTRRLYMRHGGRCFYCHQQLSLNHGLPNSVTRDHRIARARGGALVDNNVVACCQDCNVRKGSLSEAEFRDMLQLAPAQPRRKTPAATLADIWPRARP